jgi:Domain of unknown function (DUF1841).
MFNPSREQARRFFFEAWAKYRRGTILSALEDKAVAILLEHPEYQGIFEDPEANLDRDWGPESGQMNPFLHVSLHLAITEQLAIDQPRGIRALFEQRLARHAGERHRAQHDLLEALAETLWHAQRSGQSLDGELYLRLIGQRVQA